MILSLFIFQVRTKQLDLIGRDCLLLVELIRTLAMVLEVGASQRHEIMGMCGVLLDVVCTLRYHSDTTVRRSLLYALSRILLIDINISQGFGKMTNRTRSSVIEIREWLMCAVKEDSDSVCREQASVLLESGWF